MITWKELCERKIPYSFYNLFGDFNTVYPIEYELGDMLNSYQDALLKNVLIEPFLVDRNTFVNENIYLIHYELEPKHDFYVNGEKIEPLLIDEDITEIHNEEKNECNCPILNLLSVGCKCGGI